MITGHSAACICFGCLNPTTWPKDTKAPLCAPADDPLWGYPYADKKLPLVGCDCVRCKAIRVNHPPTIDAHKFLLAEKDSLIAALRKEAALAERFRTESSLHWQRILRQDKTIEELREDRKGIVKEYGECLGSLNVVIADLRKQLAEKTVTANGMTIDAHGEQSSMLLALIQFHKAKIKAMLA